MGGPLPPAPGRRRLHDARSRCPGGRLTADQAREIGIVADAFGEGPDDSAVFGNRYADITTRQDIQIHWIRIGDVPRIWERFADVGLTTVQACGDSARNVLCCPVSGVDADEVFDALPVALAISDFFTGNREYANLPRKFKISVTGCREDCAQAEINDIGLWPARADDGTLGFNVLVGGGLSDGERMASDIDVFVAPDQAVEITRAIAQLFGELGNRENRGLARMRYLVQELGPEGFRAELAARSPLRLSTRPARSSPPRYRGDHVGVHPQQRATGLRLRGVFCAGGPHVGHRAGRGRPAGQDLRRRDGPPRDRPELRADRRPRGPGRRPARRGAAPEVLALPRALRAGRGGLHRQRVLPVRRGGDQGAGREWARWLDAQLAAEPAGARPDGGTALGAGARTPASSACTSRVARLRAPSPRSPTSASGATSRTWASTS